MVDDNELKRLTERAHNARQAMRAHGLMNEPTDPAKARESSLQYALIVREYNEAAGALEAALTSSSP